MFSAPMVRAIINGKKTQTRRIVKLPTPSGDVLIDPGGTELFGPGPYLKVYEGARGDSQMYPRIRCPYGTPGDRLWVRETHAFAPTVHEPDDWRDNPDDWDTIYRADGDERPWRTSHDEDADEIAPPWRPSIFMPRWASRITLEVTGVRVERLQEISEEDARAEGVEACDGLIDEALICRAAKVIGASYEDNRGLFAALWAEINGWESLVANPWVWVVEFRRIKARERAA